MSPVPVKAKSQALSPTADDAPSEFLVPEPFLAAAFKVTPPIVLM